MKDLSESKILKSKQNQFLQQKKAQFELFQVSIPIDEMYHSLGIHHMPRNSTHAAANQVRIDILHQAMNNLCAVFALYGIDGTRCESVCNYFGIDNVNNMYSFDVSKWDAYVAEYNTPDHSIILGKIRNIMEGLSKSDFDFQVFFVQHPKCRPVKVNTINRIEWQPFHQPDSS